MLHFKTTVLQLLAFSYSVNFVHAVGCNLTNGLVGRDSGNAVFAAFEYNLTVRDGVVQTTVEDSILPSLEASFAQRTAERLIAKCAPPGQSVPNDIVGIDVQPDDYVVGKCGVGKSNCFVIHSETTIFVLSSAQGTALAYRSTLRQFFQNATFVPDNGTIVKMTGFRFAKADSIRPSEPTSSPTFILEDVQQNEGNIFDKMRALPQDNPLAFWIIIGVVVIVLVGSGLCLIKGCCSRKG
jgi:hypothetical protein